MDDTISATTTKLGTYTTGRERPAYFLGLDYCFIGGDRVVCDISATVDTDINCLNKEYALQPFGGIGVRCDAVRSVRGICR